MSKKVTDISKFLSYLLRHHPEAIGIKLDLEGWADIEAFNSSAVKIGRGSPKRKVI